MGAAADALSDDPPGAEGSAESMIIERDVSGVHLPGFSGREGADIVGITHRQLDYWARTDLI